MILNALSYSLSFSVSLQELDGLEIVGSNQPFPSESVKCCRLEQEQNEEDGSEGGRVENE